MKRRRAIVAEVSPSIGRCELTHLRREPIDVERARAQHRAYEECLRELGCRVERLPAADELPDSVFVEDAAVVFPELAVLCRPGAASRRPEVPRVERALGVHRRLVRIDEPGTMDGGDVLVLGRDVFVGLSGRTNRDGAAQLRSLLAPHGYRVRAVEVDGCLHLKSAATAIGPRAVLVQPEWVDAGAFTGFDRVEVHPAEPFAANALVVGGTAIYADAHPRTRRRLEDRGVPVRGLDVSELARAEGAVTCCSLVFES